jgi:hypothetical protein
VITPEQQVEIARQLTRSIAKEFVVAVERGIVPEDWDGFEIRQWLYEQFRREWLGTVQAKLSGRTKRGKRYQQERYQRGF